MRITVHAPTALTNLPKEAKAAYQNVLKTEKQAVQTTTSALRQAGHTVVQKAGDAGNVLYNTVYNHVPPIVQNAMDETDRRVRWHNQHPGQPYPSQGFPMI